MAYKKGWRRRKNKQKQKTEARPEPKPKPPPKPKPKFRKIDPNRHPDFTDWWYNAGR